MMSYLEWGLCLMSVYFCWWKYGWGNVELIKGFRQLLKKFEATLVSPQSTTSHSHSGTTSSLSSSRQWDVRNFMNMPVSRTHFSIRKSQIRTTGSPAAEGGDQQQQGPTKDQLAFYNYLTPQYIAKRTTRTPYVQCDICRQTQAEKASVNLVKEDSEIAGLRNCLDCDTRNPENPWYIRRFAFFIFFWRKWSIGPQYNMVPLKDMMAHKQLNEAIEEAARQDLRENPRAGKLDNLIKKHRQRAERVLTNMRAKQAKHPYFSLYCRIAAWIIGKTLALIYPKIWVEKSQIANIHKARASGYPIIYLPIHRSHVDYVLVSWTLFASNVRAPLVAAGENLNIPVFSLMMKSVGGFFIKRRLDRKEGKKDILYRAILHSYMSRSLEVDNDMEFFIEGGRTRTGKPCHPKGGLLSIAVDTLVSKKVDDILIIPVNFSYEKLLEGNYIREQLGQPKVKESFASAALGLWNSVQTKFGNARVDYGKPFSLREYIQAYQGFKSPSPYLKHLSSSSSSSGQDSSGSGSENEMSESSLQSRRSSFQSETSTSSLFGSDIVIDDQRDLVNSLARHVIHDGVKYFSLVSTSAIAFLLLNKYRNGVSMEKLVEELDALKAVFVKRNHPVIFEGDSRQVIEHGLTVLGPALVRRDLVKTDSKTAPTQIVLKPVTMVPNVIDLSYYSTCVLPIFAMESVIASSILTMMREGRQLNSTTSETALVESDLIATCVELCEILDSEFIFNPPCQTLVESIYKTLKSMQADGLIRFQSHPAGSSDSDESDEELSRADQGQGHNLVYISSSPESSSQLKFLKELLTPILDTYSVSCLPLKRLVHCEAQEKQLQMEMLAEVKSQLQQNKISFGESLGLDPIRNFIKLLVRWQVLECFTKDSISIYYLQEHFDNVDSVDEVTKRIYRFHF